MEKRTGVWIRMAGHAERIKNGEPYVWRFFIDRERPEVPIKHFVIENGEGSPRNFIPGTNSARDKLGLVAWIDLYGDVFVDDDGIAHVTLRDPK